MRLPIAACLVVGTVLGPSVHSGRRSVLAVPHAMSPRGISMLQTSPGPVARADVSAPPWRIVDETALTVGRRRLEIRGRYTVVRLDLREMSDRLSRAPAATANEMVGAELPLPMPDGTFITVIVRKSSLLAPELAAAFPGIGTYVASHAIDRVTLARLDWTTEGFHGMVMTGERTVVIDPYFERNREIYVSYDKADLYIDPAQRPRGPW